MLLPTPVGVFFRFLSGATEAATKKISPDHRPPIRITDGVKIIWKTAMINSEMITLSKAPDQPLTLDVLY